MSPYMHPIGESNVNKEGLLSFRSKLPSTGTNVRSGSVSSVYSPNSTNSTTKEHRINRAFSTSFTTLPTSQSREIVVVNEAKPNEVNQKELEKLNRIPRVVPLYLNRSLSNSFDHKSALHFCARFQEHIHQCAETISFDQNSLNVRVKEVDVLYKSMDEKLRDRHKKQAKYLEQVQKLNQITPIAERIASIILNFEAELNKLNDLLPQEMQMEPFSFRATGVSNRLDIKSGGGSVIMEKEKLLI